MSRYEPTRTGVRMIGACGPVNLTLAQADQLLGIYQEQGAKAEFNALWDAYHAHPDAVPSVSCFRRVA